jgi:hypothetical protein
MLPNNQPDSAPEAPPLLFVQLGYDRQPVIPMDVLTARLVQFLPHSRIVSNPADPSMILIHHLNHTSDMPEAKAVPIQTAIMPVQQQDPAAFQRALAQTWTWPQAKDIVPRITHELVLCEFMAGATDYKTRSTLFHSVMEILVEAAPPIALYAEYAQCFINPATLPKPSLKDPSAAPFLNIRLFQVEGMNPGDTLMDTRGLSAFGLPDLQIKFNGLGVQQVANHLYNCALYLYTRGNIIKNGDTLPGLTPSQQWTCKIQRALVEPVRPVIDLDPGKPFNIVPTEA